MFHKPFIRRQLNSAKKQSTVLILCIALSMVILVAINGFGESVNRALTRDAKILQAGDIIIDSSFALSQPVRDAVSDLEARGLAESTLLTEFYSVVRAIDEDNSLLANLKVVEAGYPFYGVVELASGRDFQQTLTPGKIIVEQALLDRLGMQLGDSLRVGETTLTIVDVLRFEPDRPVNFFSLGPRIFASAADLEAMELVKKGSRVRYRELLKVNDERGLDELAVQLEAVAMPDQERVETYRTAESGVKRFFDNFLFYLSLIGVFTLLLAGIGIQSALTAFLKEQESTIAIVKTMGATRRFITGHYMTVVAIFGVIGTVLGFGSGFLLQRFFPILFGDLLPPNVELLISGRAIVESLLLGFVVVSAFTFLPLYRLQEVKPSFIFRNEFTRLKRGWPYYLTILLVFLFFCGIVLWQINTLETGLYFIGGSVALLLVTALLTEAVLFITKRQHIKSLLVRQAVRGLFRPRNATRSITITLAASLAIIFAFYLIEQNLDSNFLQSFPEDAPNVFFIDIQPDQADAFAAELGVETEYFPVIRARISAVNGQPIDRDLERERDGENLARTFNLSYRDHLLEGESIIAGTGLNQDGGDGIQVSILDDMLDVRPFELGDTITFNIQGLPLEARITSIRSRTTEDVRPFFNFVFDEQSLKDAPQTIFTAIRVEKEEIPALQNRIVAAFPNVNVIDVTEAISTFGQLMQKLSSIIRFFTLFSIVAGVLIIISSVFATRFARTQEAVYFKVLGAKGRFVLQVFALENLFLGLVSGALALLMSQVGSWIISVTVFEIDYRPLVGASLTMMAMTTLLVISIGLLASFPILKQKPISFLREQTEE